VMNGRNEPATGHQLHTIACLSQSLGIKEQIEETPMTLGEAGLIIRRLKNERRHHKTRQKYLR